MSTPNLTFEALLERISADDGLSSGRKANIASAIRSFVKATGSPSTRRKERQNPPPSFPPRASAQPEPS